MSRLWIYYFVVVILLRTVKCSSVEIKIGGVFCNDIDEKERNAFLLGIDYINSNSSILSNRRLVAVVNSTSSLDSFDNIKSAYWQIHDGISMMIGPMLSGMVKSTYPLCQGFGGPQISPYATDTSFIFSSNRYGNLIRMSSSDSKENQALAELISHFNWTRVALLSSRSEYGLNGLVTFKEIASHKGWKIVASETFQEYTNVSKVNATTQLIHLRGRGARIIVLNSMAQYVHPVLQQARDLGVLKDRVWILTNGAFAHQGLYTPGADIPDYLKGIVGLRHSFGNGPMVKTFKSAWTNSGYQKIDFENEAAVGHTFDAVLVAAHALQKFFDQGNNLTDISPSFGVYEDSSTARRTEGHLLVEAVKSVNTSGVMADHLRFDSIGSPIHDQFDIVNLRSFGFKRVGHWTPTDRLVMEPNEEIVWPSGHVDIPSDSAVLIQNRTLRVVTIHEPPFVYVYKNHQGSGNKYVYGGLCMELLKIIAEKLKFSYEIYPVADSHFGSQDVITKEWNGLVGDILQGKADIAVASFTISPSRQRVIDFTQPFIDLGLTALMKSVTEKTGYFTVFRPFRYDLWLAIGFTMIVVGFFLWFFSTFSPYGYYGRCVQTCLSRVPSKYLKYRDTLTLVRSLWSSVVYYVGQSSDHLHPVSSSGRITVTVWWFAGLIIVSTYTANLAAFRTIHRSNSPITAVSELGQQTQLSYGTVEDSQPKHFFESSTIPSYITMWQHMQAHNTLVKSSEEGIEKVLQGNYAFIWDSAVLEHVVHKQTDCDKLVTVGSLLGKIGYGFGLPKDSPFTKQLTSAILELKHSGILSILEKKWIHDDGRCHEENAVHTADNSVMDLQSLSGVFIVVAIGIACSLIVLIFEWIWAAYGDINVEDNSNLTLLGALDARRKLAFHDWRHREDIPKVRKHVTLIWDSVRPMLPTRRPRKIDPLEHDVIESGDLTYDSDTGLTIDRIMSVTEQARREKDAAINRIMSVTQQAELEYDADDDDDAESYVV